MKDDEFVLKPLNREGTDDVKIISEVNYRVDEPIRTKVFLKRLRGLSGVIIIFAITACCLVLFVGADPDSKKYDDVVKFLTLILGAVLGSVFHQNRKGGD